VRLWYVSIDVKVARGFGQLQVNAGHGLGDDYLTSQSTRLGQAVGHIEHIIFILGRPGKRIVYLLRQDQVTSGAGADWTTTRDW
jgi:hypothetical protein